MVTVWWKKTCKTSKKGIDYLKGKKIGFELIDILESSPPRELLESHIGGNDLKRFINTSSKPYRELGIKNGMPSREKLIGLMLEHPDLIKRPVMYNGDKVSFGFDPAAIDEVVK